MTIYDRAQVLAQRALEKFGGNATLNTITRIYDPLTGTSVDSIATTETRAVIGTRKAMSANGVLVMQTVATLLAEPKVDDRLVIGTTTYEVASVETVAPIGTAIIYRAVLR